MQAGERDKRRPRRSHLEQTCWSSCCGVWTATTAVVLLTVITSTSLLQVQFYRSSAGPPPRLTAVDETQHRGAVAAVPVAMAVPTSQRQESGEHGATHRLKQSSNATITRAFKWRGSVVAVTDAAAAASARPEIDSKEKAKQYPGEDDEDDPHSLRPPGLSSRAVDLLRLYDPDAQLPVFWNCSRRENSERTGEKFIFVHVFKTAGSSMRDFLSWYGRRCGPRSVAMVIGCSGVSSSSLNGTVWREASSRSGGGHRRGGGGRSCTLSHAFDASSGREYSGGTFGRDLYEHVDVVGGHLPLGVHPPHQRGAVQYLTFVRDPLNKYVSGKLYSNRHRKWTAEDAIKRISYEISHLYRKGGHYEKYSSYLLTPAQKEEKMSEDEKAITIQSNLAGMPVLVGVVERMDESYQLLQRVLDGAGELESTFRLLRSKALVRNKSALSTTEIVRQLKANDLDFERQARVVLKEEYMIYDFAVKLHELQYDRLVLQSRGRQWHPSRATSRFP
jgi:hypothetical protein